MINHEKNQQRREKGFIRATPRAYFKANAIIPLHISLKYSNIDGLIVERVLFNFQKEDLTK